MRVIHNAKRVSVLVGGLAVGVGGLGLWRAVTLLNDHPHGREAVLTTMFAAVAFIRGCVILLWDRRSTPTALVRPQAADVALAAFPLTVFAAFFVSQPEVRDPAGPVPWLVIMAVCSTAIVVKPARDLPALEIPPLRSMNFVDWIRIQNFGSGSLVIAIWFTVMYLVSPLRVDSWTPPVIALATLQAAVSLWRLVEQHQMSKAGLHLTAMQIIWLRAVHVQHGQGAAEKALRVMYPKVGTGQAERVIENLYRTQEV